MPPSKAGEVNKRRELVLKLICEGYTTREMSEMLVKEGFRASIPVLDKDRAWLKQELKREMTFKDKENILVTYLFRYNSIFKRATKLYRDTKHELIKLGAINAMQRNAEAELRILQSLGIVDPEPGKETRVTFAVYKRPKWLNDDAHKQQPGESRSGIDNPRTT